MSSSPEVLTLLRVVMSQLKCLPGLRKTGTATGGIGCYIEEGRGIFLAIATIAGVRSHPENQDFIVISAKCQFSAYPL
ncbi:hypothetical protein J0895_06575 [Phormidium pseudopriestleyi FRX01]|uniref:Uncharacterized protein n=1 Tax=Phormidium pseudopriestleyi FRX01 TaxID=1759528 RepID=A0ABS3FNV1_9CYAN|nr:hypothetical protein [Phormidium pseudopriestleyi]MBO0348770.1 hypothetical protein [Phormidium pseudopriestleyi FRX01]